MKGIKFLSYNDRHSDPRHIKIKKDKWGIDEGFEPFFYVHGINRMKINEYDFQSTIRKIEDDWIKILWTGEEIDVLRVITDSPSAVGSLAALLPDVCEEASVFSGDVPYLRNYLIHSETNIYEGVDRLETIILDIEADVTSLERAIGKPLLMGISEGYFDLNEVKYFEEERYALQDEDKVQMAIDTANLLESKDLVVCHNVKFDIGLLFNYLQKNQYYKFRTNHATIFQGSFRLDKIKIPRNIGFFDTVLATDVALQRPKASPLNLKRLVDSLEIREESRVEIAGDKIASTFKTNPSLVEEYCLDDIEDTMLLFNYLAPSVFVSAKESGVLAQTILLTGVKVVWETMLMRRCVENNFAVPHFSKKAKHREKQFACPHIVDLPRIKGGHTIKPKRTNVVIKDVLHIDVGADYPNIMLQYNISPETVFLVEKGHVFDKESFDYHSIEFENGSKRIVGIVKEKGFLPDILEPILNKTIELKKLSKKDKKYKQAYQGFKGLRNSSFGFMGIQEGDTRFPNQAASGLITQIGRRIMEIIIECVENYEE